MSNAFVDEERKISDWKLSFNNRRFHKGLNVTFRNGNDYALSMKPGDNMLMVDRFGRVISKATIIGSEALDIKKFPNQVEYLLRFEPDYEVKTLEDLTKVFNEGYGEKNWGPTVTAVFFWVE